MNALRLVCVQSSLCSCEITDTLVLLEGVGGTDALQSLDRARIIGVVKLDTDKPPVHLLRCNADARRSHEGVTDNVLRFRECSHERDQCLERLLARMVLIPAIGKLDHAANLGMNFRPAFGQHIRLLMVACHMSRGGGVLLDKGQMLLGIHLIRDTLLPQLLAARA
jgi:hypothetical protein